MQRKPIHFWIVLIASVVLIIVLVLNAENYELRTAGHRANELNSLWIIYNNVHVLIEQVTAVAIWLAVVVVTLAHAWLMTRAS